MNGNAGQENHGNAKKEVIAVAGKAEIVGTAHGGVTDEAGEVVVEEPLFEQLGRTLINGNGPDEHPGQRSHGGDGENGGIASGPPGRPAKRKQHGRHADETGADEALGHEGDARTGAEKQAKG